MRRMSPFEKEFKKYIKHEIEGIENNFENNNLKLLWLAVVHEATWEMLKERNLTPFGAFMKWKEG